MAARRSSRRNAPGEVPGEVLLSLQTLAGVGPKVALQLARAGVTAPGTLPEILPRSYLDLRQPTPLADWRPDSGVPIVCRGELRDLRQIPTRRRGLRLVRGVLHSAGSGPSGHVTCVWFNQPYLARSLPRGIVRVSGALRRRRGGQIELHNPLVVHDDDAALIPVYGRLGELGPARVRRLVLAALEQGLGSRGEAIPDAHRRRLGLLSRDAALSYLHEPPQDLTSDEVQELSEGRSAGHRRLLFDFLLRHQAGLLIQREGLDAGPGKPNDRYRIDDRVRQRARDALPFRLTSSQRQVVREVVDDLRRPKPCRRLIQGDVGCGKTIVAVLAALVAAESGLQVAVMAPTEVLVHQLYEQFSNHLPASIEVQKVTAETAGSQRDLRGPEGPSVVIGTQALLGGSVRFRDLGLVIIDEQHRFGVSQRDALTREWPTADLLIMTATPIPRSLALFLYGELDLSTIGELPDGRQPVRTSVRGAADRHEAFRDLRRELEEGGRAFVVFPRIREAEAESGAVGGASLQGLRQRYERELEPFACATITGEDDVGARREVLERFRRGEISCLLATTVIEVGIDVPEASAIVIEGADRFGLAQLHQLRGRVGRGARRSWCLALYDTQEEPERLETFARVDDGFELAEADLRQRGPGQLLGTAQSGLGDGLWCRALDERELVDAARAVAQEMWANSDRRAAWLQALGLQVLGLEALGMETEPAAETS